MYLKSVLVSPPGGWHYRQPESGYAMSAINLGTLVRKVAAHRYNMGYPTEGDLAQELEAYTCARLSPEDQQEYCKTGLKLRNRVHYKQVESFLRVVAAEVLAGAPLVSTEEAERRAMICSKCPLNVGTGGCGICESLLQGLRESVLKKSTSLDSELKACGVCGCDNKTQVHLPLEILAKGVPHNYPNFCWKSELNPS